MAEQLDALAVDRNGHEVSRQNIVLLALAIWVCGICALYFSTLAGMVNIWSRSDTFTHGFLVAPISLWLAWRMRGDLLPLLNRGPSLWMLWLLLPAALLWFLAYLVSVQLVMQLAFVGMLAIGLAAVMGWPACRQALFPLGFLFLAVPMGLSLEPPMMDLTAHYTVKMIQYTGIPVYQEGRFFQLPTGSWSVVEACSGVRYLIASITLGLLYAHLNYRSMKRKLAFIALSVVVPVVANVLRAYLIVMLGHLSGMKLAAGVDHLIYGWIFFGVVMFLLFWIGGFWTDPEMPDDEDSDSVEKERESTQDGSVWPGLILALGIAALAPAAVAFMRMEMPGRVLLDVEPLAVANWRCSESTVGSWMPRAGDADRRVSLSCEGKAVVQVIADQYLGQTQGGDISELRRGLRGEDEHPWQVLADEMAVFPTAGQGEQQVQEALLRDDRGQLVLVAGWYLVDGQVAPTPFEAKLLQAWRQLQRKHVISGQIYVAVELGSEGEEGAREVLRDFLRAVGVALNRSLTSTAPPGIKEPASGPSS